jgi:hypothetical protein
MSVDGEKFYGRGYSSGKSRRKVSKGTGGNEGGDCASRSRGLTNILGKYAGAIGSMTWGV